MARKKKGKGDEAEAPTPAEGAEPEVGKKKGGMLPAIIVAVAVLAGGAMAGGIIGGGGDAAAAAVPEPQPTATVAELGTVVELESVTLNLAGGSHFLKLGVAVELSPEVVEEPQTAPIYDIVIAQFGTYSYDDLVNATQRQASKDELLANLAEVYGEATISRVFYTEFVMQ